MIERRIKKLGGRPREHLAIAPKSQKFVLQDKDLAEQKGEKKKEWNVTLREEIELREDEKENLVAEKRIQTN